MKTLIKKALLVGALSAALTSMAFANSERTIYINRYNSEGELITKTSSMINDQISEDSKIYVTSKNNLVDSLTGGVLIAENKGAHLYSDQNFDGKVLNIIGGPNSVSGDITNSENIENRFHGETRYETAVEIAHELGTDRDIILCSGENFADALPATSLAAKDDMNILLVTGYNIPEPTKEYLQKYSQDKNIIIIGGEDSVSAELEKEVSSITNASNIRRIYGENRFETSKSIANEFEYNTGLVLADGNVKDITLLSSILASKNEYPLILVNESSEVKLDEYTNERINNLLVLTNKNTKITDQGEANYFDLDGNTIDYQSLNSNEPNLEQETQPTTPVEEKDNITVLENGDKINHDKKVIVFANGEVRSFTKVYNMNTTAYNLFPGSTGYTASGTKARHGAVAVDPNVIPLGTELYIQSTDDWPSYGKAIAEDTGGAIKGNKLDVFYDSYNTVINFGRRETVVYILGK